MKELAFLLLLAAPFTLWASVNVDYRVTGMALYRAGQYQKALVYFLTAIRNNPKDWKAYEDLGSTYERLNDPVDALIAYRRSLHLEPGDSNLRIYVQRLTQSVGDITGIPTATPPPLPPQNLPTPSNP
jgi:tetratricopeptide (TPR) repeat protein